MFRVFTEGKGQSQVNFLITTFRDRISCGSYSIGSYAWTEHSAPEARVCRDLTLQDESSAAGGLDGLALAIGLHLMMEEVVPTTCWNAIDAASVD